MFIFRDRIYKNFNNVTVLKWNLKRQTVITDNLEIYIRLLFYHNLRYLSDGKEPNYVVDNNLYLRLHGCWVLLYY